jgi:hypothetical protein
MGAAHVPQSLGLKSANASTSDLSELGALPRVGLHLLRPFHYAYSFQNPRVALSDHLPLMFDFEVESHRRRLSPRRPLTDTNRHGYRMLLALRSA